ncbi:hypothetical protein [Asticcacaulis solisilvae]|uniref:hypothetical protein n=1 Tax=Asticcacaulis solisilvae TaxID=1217274 RepID=UPI003FD87C47
MRKERTLNVAKALTVQLHATEEAIDTALSEAAHLIEAYVTSRRAIHMSATVPGQVHENTLKAMMALNTAQQYMTAAHEGLDTIQKQLGIEAIVDPYYTKPDKGGGQGSGVTNSERQLPQSA